MVWITVKCYSLRNYFAEIHLHVQLASAGAIIDGSSGKTPHSTGKTHNVLRRLTRSKQGPNQLRQHLRSPCDVTIPDEARPKASASGMNRTQLPLLQASV